MRNLTSAVSPGWLGQASVHSSQEPLVNQGHEQTIPQSAKAPKPWGLFPSLPHSLQPGTPKHHAGDKTTTSSQAQSPSVSSVDGPHPWEATAGGTRGMLEMQERGVFCYKWAVVVIGLIWTGQPSPEDRKRLPRVSSGRKALRPAVCLWTTLMGTNIWWLTSNAMA